MTEKSQQGELQEAVCNVGDHRWRATSHGEQPTMACDNGDIVGTIYFESRGMLHPAARDVITDFFIGTNHMILSLVFYLLQLVFCFATSSIFICYYRRQPFFATQFVKMMQPR